MGDQAAGMMQLRQELESWTQKLLTHVSGVSGVTHSVSAESLTEHPLHSRSTVARALLSAVQRILSSSSQLHRLPALVLQLICQYLLLTERIALSHVSHYIRDRLLSLPGVWSDIDSRDVHRPYISADVLQALAARSMDKRLQLFVTLYDCNILSSLPVVALNLHRISALSLTVHTEHDFPVPSTSDPAFWKAMLDALLAPAPHLERLSLFLFRRFTWTNSEEFYEHVRNPVPLSPTILAGHGPLLRTLQLSGVRLSSIGCMAFRNVTCFNFSRSGSLALKEVAHAVALLPQLQTLGLTAFGIRSARPGSTVEYPLPSPLRNLLLRLQYLKPESLCRVIDFRQLRFLDVYLSEAADVVALYAALSIKRLVMADRGDVITVEDDSGNPLTTIRMMPCANPIVGTWSAVTWLALHEFRWPGSGIFHPASTAMPAVVTLCICLAACDESLHPSLADPIGIFVHNFAPGSAWRLAALRKLCITAPSACLAASTHSTCLGSRSVALSDVARFVRLGVQFDAPRLDKVRLAGLRIIDIDFCAAWNEMSACAEVVELVEEPELIPGMDLHFPWEYDLETVFQDR